MKKHTLTTLILLAVFLLMAANRSEAAAAPKKIVVVNDPSAPVPTRDADNSANQPIQAMAFASLGTLTGPANFVLYTVPAGKRLVVEHFSSQVGIASSASVNRYILGTAPDPVQPGNTSFVHFVAPAYHSPCGTCAGTTELFVASQAIRMHVDAGNALVVNITFSGSVGPFGFGSFSFSGYLVDFP